MNDSQNSDANVDLAWHFHRWNGGESEAASVFRQESARGRAAALYLWAHLDPTAVYQWCAAHPSPPPTHVLQMQGCLMHWGLGCERNDPVALTAFWLAGKQAPSLADELERERVFELIPSLRRYPREADLQIPPGLHHQINRRVWQIRALWRGETEE